jgi:biotin synthase
MQQTVNVAGAAGLDWSEFVRASACARITMPASHIRLSAGRRAMPKAVQALCLLAGAHSIFYGDRPLTTANPDAQDDRALLRKLGLAPE